jgi:PhnB protein
MTIQQIQPYLFFEGRAEEAIEYYKRTLGAEVEMAMRYKENPDNPPPEMMPPNSADKIMHASLKIGGAVLMLSDGMCSGKPNFSGVSLTLSVPSAAEADRAFDALKKDGKVEMPMAKTFFSPRFGAVADKFGVSWMVIAEPEAQAEAA